MCPMDIKKAKALREAWGDKPCKHPDFSKESISGLIGTQFIESKTGEYICTQCGRTFSRNEKIEIENLNQISSSN